MKFYGRENEVDELRKIRHLSKTGSRMTVLTGRRRIGKTELVDKALNDGEHPYLYLLITRRVEKELCGILQEEVERGIGHPIAGHAVRFAELFEAVMIEAMTHPLTLVIDEFQEFDRINAAVFGEIAGIWDRYHKKSRINLVISGSVNRLMNKIFFSDSEPLYGRNTGTMRLAHFPLSELKRILTDHNPDWTNEDLLALWTLTGGVARYVEILMDDHAYTRKAMLKSVCSSTSLFFDEGRTVLADEFGKDYGTYFSILSAIANGNTSFSDLSNAVGVEIGGHLTKMERDYGLIAKIRPAYETRGNRNVSYRIDDCFFRFWFRFIYKYQYLIEQRQLKELLTLMNRDFGVFSGYALELYFREKFIEEHAYTRIGGWWDRKGENEIDLVCENELTRRLDFYEVKTDPDRLRLGALEAKAESFLVRNPQFRDRKTSCRGVSVCDM